MAAKKKTEDDPAKGTGGQRMVSLTLGCGLVVDEGKVLEPGENVSLPAEYVAAHPWVDASYNAPEPNPGAPGDSDPTE